jgi:hypothetical protein
MKLYGPTEVRYAWKYNDLKPRVYYAMGATAYYSSRYARDIWNSLIEMFPPTAVQSRYYLQRLNPISKSDTVAIYDYASFTSNLTELKYFTEALAEWTKDIPVTVIDTHDGPVDMSLGDLLMDYNDVCNRHPEMDLRRIYSSDETFIEPHRKAGLLGVYGNIVSSTLLHGLILTSITGALDRCNVVGDDAVGKFEKEEYPEEEDITMPCSLLGLVHNEKWKLWEWDDDEEETDGWHFCKRPVDRILGNLFGGQLFDWPNFAVALGLSDGIHTVQVETIGDRRRLCLTQSCRMLDKLFHLQTSLSQEERSFLFHTLRYLFHRVGIPLGRLPGHGVVGITEYPTPFLDETDLEVGWFTNVRNHTEDKSFSRPQFWLEEDQVAEADFREESIWCGRMSRSLNLAVDLGYLEAKMAIVTVSTSDHELQLLEDFMAGLHLPFYHFHVVSSPPEWLVDLASTPYSF